MLAVGFLIMWGGYSVSLWGWCLLRGYDVTLGQLMSPTHPYGSGKGQKWPPPLIKPDVIFPGGRSSGTSLGGTPQLSEVGAFNTNLQAAGNAAVAVGQRASFRPTRSGQPSRDQQYIGG